MATATQPQASASVPISELLHTWYLIARSRDIRRGTIHRTQLGAEPVIVFRDRELGILRALPAHCKHMGVDLSTGHVAGRVVRCPLHHWEYTDRCVAIPGCSQVPASLRRAHYQVEERYGMVFLYRGTQTPSALPSFSMHDLNYLFRSGAPVSIDCPWFFPIINAYDTRHLATVHRRELLDTSGLQRISPSQIQLRYTTAVVGHHWHDWVMRFLSGNRIHATMTCHHGTLLTIETQVRQFRTALLIGVRPNNRGGVVVQPVFGFRRTPFTFINHLSLYLASKLFTAFLSRDLKPLNGVAFRPGFTKQDRDAQLCFDYFTDLSTLSQKERP